MRTEWLLVIDFPDERINTSQYDHMHAWFETEGEAQQTRRLLVDQLGDRDHYVVRGPCPRCGAE